MSPFFLSIISVLIVSLASLVGVLLLALNETILKRLLLILVSFSIGALLGNVFLHLMPEIIEHNENMQMGFLFILVGMLFSFIIEKFIHWRHCHDIECQEHTHPVGTLVLIGDAAHNMIDGILIATAYIVSPQLGVATTIAVLLHEIPQEFGDFAILLHSGFTKQKALLYNFISALSAVLGAMLVFLLASSVHNIEGILLPLAAGNFLYIAGSDLIPELHKETRLGHAFLQLIVIIAGIALMQFFSGHGDEEVHQVDEHTTDQMHSFDVQNIRV